MAVSVAGLEKELFSLLKTNCKVFDTAAPQPAAKPDAARKTQPLRTLQNALSALLEQRPHAVREILTLAPDEPGVYHFLDAAGEVVYVGKAKRLRRRLATYLNVPLASRRKRHRKPLKILRAAASCTWVASSTHLDACILELQLIQSLKPRLNVSGTFSGTYPYPVSPRSCAPLLRRIPAPHGLEVGHFGVADQAKTFSGEYDSAAMDHWRPCTSARLAPPAMNGRRQYPLLFPESRQVRG